MANMTFKLASRVFVLFGCHFMAASSLIAILGCKEQAKDNKNVVLDTPSTVSSSNASIGAQVGDENLKVFNLSTSALEYNAQVSSLQLYAESDDTTDFMQFYICSKQDPNLCNPRKDQPKTFTIGEVTFPDAPEGAVDVFVRACTRGNEIRCGNWESTVFFQKKNENVEILSMLRQQENIDLGMKKKCAKIFALLEEAQSNQSGGRFQELVDNLSQIGQDLGCEFITNGQMEVVEESVRENLKSQPGLNLAEDFLPDVPTLGVTLLTLGSAGVISAMAYGYTQRYNFKNVINGNGVMVPDRGFGDSIGAFKKIADKQSLRAALDRDITAFNADSMDAKLENKKLDPMMKTEAQLKNKYKTELYEFRKAQAKLIGPAIGGVFAAGAMAAGVILMDSGANLALTEKSAASEKPDQDFDENKLLNNLGEIYSSIKSDLDKKSILEQNMLKIMESEQ